MQYYQLFRAEWLKTAGNRWATSFFMWIFPFGALAIYGLFIVVVLLSSDARESVATEGMITTWDEALLGPWTLVNNEFGRWIVAAFTAFVFAGEYAHGTWKNLITRRPRYVLILNKFATVVIFVLTSWAAMSVIVFIGQGLVNTISGVGYGEFNSEILGDFLSDYALQVFITFMATFIAASYAALAAMFTKHVMASVFVAIVLNIAETGFMVPLFFLRGFFDINLLGLYMFTPGYNLANISSWASGGEGMEMLFGDVPTILTLEQSLLIITTLVIGFVGFTVYRFMRQDILT